LLYLNLKKNLFLYPARFPATQPGPWAIYPLTPSTNRPWEELYICIVETRYRVTNFVFAYYVKDPRFAVCPRIVELLGLLLMWWGFSNSTGEGILHSLVVVYLGNVLIQEKIIAVV